MAHRTFIDARGMQWDVWAVIPQWADRRAGQGRRTRHADADAAAATDTETDPPVPEQPRTVDRRRGLPDQFPRIRLTGGLEGGWLAFECGRERRRLSPIPPGWDALPDVELERMCAGAAPAPPPRRLVE